MKWTFSKPLGFKKNKKIFLFSEDYLLFSTIIFLVASFVSAFICYNIYYSYVQTVEENLVSTSHRLDQSLSNIFNQTSRLMIYISKQIAESDHKNLKSIENLLKNTSGNEYKTKHLLSWTLFDWVGPDCLQWVNGTTGISSNPPNMSHRTYTWKSRKKPWTLQLSEPAIGEPSGMWVIPAGMGLTNKKGDFLGTLVAGFDITELKKILFDQLSLEKYDFLVLDDECNIILESYQASGDLENTFKKQCFFLKTGNLLRNPIEHNGSTYSFYKKMAEYPYVILTGYNNVAYNQGFYSLVLPPITEIIGMGVFSFMLLHVFRKRIVALGKKSDKAKQDFMRLTNQKLKSHIDVILENSELLIHFLRGDFRVGMDKNRQFKCISTVYESALQVKNFTSNTLTLSLVNINKIIDESIDMYAKKSTERQITIKTELENHLPLLEADELCIRQIISGLLSYAIEYGPAGSYIWLSTSLKKTAHKNFLMLTIEDNGFGLSQEDVGRIKMKFESSDFDWPSVIEPDFKVIEKLISLHKGSCDVINTVGEGCKVIVLLPYAEQKSSSCALEEASCL